VSVTRTKGVIKTSTGQRVRNMNKRGDQAKIAAGEGESKAIYKIVLHGGGSLGKAKE